MVYVAIEISSPVNAGCLFGVFATRQAAIDAVNGFSEEEHYVDENGVDTWGDYDIQVIEVKLDEHVSIGI